MPASPTDDVAARERRKRFLDDLADGGDPWVSLDRLDQEDMLLGGARRIEAHIQAEIERPLELVQERRDPLVCADGGNSDPTLTHGKDAQRAKEVELAGFDAASDHNSPTAILSHPGALSAVVHAA